MFDQWVRTSNRANGFGWNRAWHGLPPQHIARCATYENAVGIFGVLSAHANGRVREAAVRELASIHDGNELGYLLVRLNDWVEEIRQRSKSAVLERLHARNAGTLIRFLPLLLRLSGMRRGQHEQIVCKALNVLGDDACKVALREGLSSSDRDLSRACFRVVAGMDNPRAESFMENALQSGDSFLRFHAFKRALEMTIVERLPELFARGRSDTYMPIRREALEMIVARTPALAEEALRGALLDRHATIRDLARYYFKKMRDFDSLAFYLEKIGTEFGANLTNAIRGLGETGKSEHLAIVGPFLFSEEGTKRKAALTAAANLAPEEVIPILLRALADSAPGVSKTAQRALRLHLQLVPKDELMTILQESKMAHVRRNTITLILRSDKWDRLIAALRCYSDADPEMASRAQGGLRAWLRGYNRNYLVAPSQKQLDETEDALVREKDRVPKKHFEEISGLIRHWRNR